MNPQDNQPRGGGFRPAPNPFEKATDQPHVDTPAQPPLHDGVELVGKRAEDKPTAQSADAQPAKKRNPLSLIFGSSKKPTAEEKVSEKPNVPEQVLLSWQAPEFVQTHKPAGWYVGIILFFAVLIGLALLTRQYITVGLFALMGIVLVMYSNRPPRVLEYQISNYGVTVGDKKYLFDDFSSYYEISDYGRPLLELVPNKRFGTLVSLPPKSDEIEQIEQTLGQMLPKTESQQDYIDKLFRYLRF